MYGGEFAVTQSEVQIMLNDVNLNGLACYDLCMKSEKGCGYWMQHYFKAEPSKDNPKMAEDFDPQQYAPSGWDGADWHNWRLNHVHPNVGHHDDNRRSDWKSQRRNHG